VSIANSPEHEQKRPRVVLIAGPTASGKSALAVALARALTRAGQAAVIINADASQVYADIPILSARPTATEMNGIPHRLFGHIDAAEACDAARWAGEARAEVAAAYAAGAIPILVGGTGLYIRTLLDGIAPVPAVDAAVRSAVRALAVGDAYRALQHEDPHAAARLQPLDKSRIARALEVVRAIGTPLHVWQQRKVGGIAGSIALTPLILLPPRAALRARCDARLAAMFARGAADEVQALLDRRLPPDLPVMRAIGVPQIAAWLAGEMTEAEALAYAGLATHQYAKRQSTWLRNQCPADWPRHDESLNHAEIDNLAIKLRDRLLTA
jgi:tRNA dimethylallyltransferase